MEVGVARHCLLVVVLDHVSKFPVSEFTLTQLQLLVLLHHSIVLHPGSTLLLENVSLVQGVVHVLTKLILSPIYRVPSLKRLFCRKP